MGLTPVPREMPRLLRSPWKVAALVVLVVLNGLAFWDFALLSRDLISGGRFADSLLVRPAYHPTRLPPGPETKAHRAVRRIGADFAQVYFPAQHVAQLENAYRSETTSSPWQMRSHYAPLVILSCAATLCRFDYGLAVVLHHVLQVLLLYAAIYLTLSHFGVRHWFIPTALSLNAFLFLTPAGLSWFERGQFAVYVGAGYLTLVLGLIRRQPALMAASASLLFIKWTSLPAAASILALYALIPGSWREFRSRLILLAAFALTFGLLLLVPAIFVQGTDAFLQALLTQESSSFPRGISLTAYVPGTVVKLLPLFVPLLGFITIRPAARVARWLVPFSAGAATLMLTYPAQAYEYGLPSVVGFIPMLLAWARRAEAKKEKIARFALSIAFAAFVAAAALSTRLLLSTALVVGSYVGASLLLILSTPLLSALEHRSQHSAGNAASA